MASVSADTFRALWALTLNSGASYAWKRPIDGTIMKEIKINDKMLKAVLSSAIIGKCSLLEVVASLLSSRAANVHGKFCQLLPLPINHNLLVLTRGSMFLKCVRSVMLHAEHW